MPQAIYDYHYGIEAESNENRTGCLQFCRWRGHQIYLCDLGQVRELWEEKGQWFVVVKHPQ